MNHDQAINHQIKRPEKVNTFTRVALGLFALAVIWVAYSNNATHVIDRTCEVTWYHAKDHTVAANPRHRIPDGAYIQFTNRATAPASVVIVRKRGHMNPKAKADFDLCPEAFKQLAPLDEGRLKEVEWRVVYP